MRLMCSMDRENINWCDAKDGELLLHMIVLKRKRTTLLDVMFISQPRSGILGCPCQGQID